MKKLKSERRATNYPYYNILKRIAPNTWGKYGSSNDIRSVLDSSLNSKVILVDGPAAAVNHVTIPSLSKSRLQLTERYLYLIIKPICHKPFLLRIDCKTDKGVIFRITLSNALKQTKISNLSLYLPLSSLNVSPDDSERKWCILRLNLYEIISEYSDYRYHSLSRLQICCSLFLYAAFTSDNEYSPFVPRRNVTQKYTGEAFLPVPNEFWPSNYSENLSSLFDLVMVPENTSDDTCSKTSEKTGLSSDKQDKILDGSIHSPVPEIIEKNETFVKPADKEILKMSTECENNLKNDGDLQSPDSDVISTGITSQEDAETNLNNNVLDLVYAASCPSYCNSIIITQNGRVIIFPCAAFIIVMEIASKQQCFLEGHTAEIVSICQDTDGRLIGSCQSPIFDQTNSCFGIVHVWRMPNAPYSSKRIEYPLGVGRIHNIQSFKGVCISERGEFLITYGLDIRLRGLVAIWDLRNLFQSSALPLLARSTIDSNPVSLCLLPNGFNENDTSDSSIRFATVSGRNPQNETIIDSNKYQCCKKKTFSEIRLWRFKYPSIKQGLIKEFNDITIKNKYHLSSSPIPLTVLLNSSFRHSLNFISCCIKCQILKSDQLNSGELNYSLLVGSSTGHILEIDPNLFCISNVYQLTRNSQEYDSNTVDLQLLASREFINDQWILNFQNKLNNSKGNLIPITSLHWIYPGGNFSLGWLAICTQDGCIILWDLANSTDPVILSVKYPSIISAVHSCWKSEVGEAGKSLHQVFIAIATCSGGLACLDLDFKYNIQKNVITADKLETMNEFTLIKCTPRRLLSWQAYSAVIAADMIQSDKVGSQCVLATLSADGILRIRNISSSSSSISQHEANNNSNNKNVPKMPGILEDSNTAELTEDPLIDLVIPDEIPSHIVIQPRLDWSKSTVINNGNDQISWLRIVCGYPGSGLIRVFSPSNTKMLKELDFHKGYDITALMFSPCGNYLYTSDSSGQLAAWRIIVNNDAENSCEILLMNSLNHHICIFKSMQPMIMKEDNNSIKLSETKQSIITICSKGLYIAYMGPQVGNVTIAEAVNLSTVVQIDLFHLISKYFQKDDSTVKYNDTSYFMKSLHYIQFIRQVNNNSNKKNSCLLFVCTSRGHLFKFTIPSGKLISCAEFPIVSQSTNSEIYISAMKINPNSGHTLLLSETSSPFIYIASTNLYPLHESQKNNHNDGVFDRSIIIYQKFIGHIYPVDKFYFTFDEKYCISIDRGYWNNNNNNDQLYTTNKQMKASSIFFWKFQEIQPVCESKGEEYLIEENLKIDNSQSIVQVPTSVQPPYQSSECENKLSLPPLTPTLDSQCIETCSEKSILNNVDSNKTNDDNCETYKQNTLQDDHPPLCHRHWTVFTDNQPISGEVNINMINELKFAPIGEELLKGSIGFGCFNHMIDNLIWDSDTGLFIYTYESLLIFEELETGLQSAYRSVINHSSEYNKVFHGEILNSLALIPNKSVLAIGSTSYWHLSEKKSSCPDIISTLITIPIKFNQYSKYSTSLTSLPILKCDLSKRFLLPINNQTIKSYSAMEDNNTLLYGILLTMSFTMDSRYLITIEDYHTNGLKLWSTYDWTILSSVYMDGYCNQILCSPLFANEFITIGGHLNHADDNGVKSMHRESLILFWKIDIKHSRYTADYQNSYTSNVMNSDKPLTCIKGITSLQDKARFVQNTEYCSATYMKIPNKLDYYYTTMPKMILLLLVADNFGQLTVWDVNSHACIYNFSAECNEISVISSCGPYGFVTGSTNGLLHQWRLDLEFSSSDHISMHHHNSLIIKSNSNSYYNGGIKNVNVKLMKSIHYSAQTGFLSACFDLEGQIGVVSTNDCNLWYVDWSEVEGNASCCRTSEVETSLSETPTGITVLSSGHKTQITGLVWWPKRDQQFVNTNENNDQLSTSSTNSNDIIVTCSLDGSVRLWNSETRQLLSELQVNESVNTSNKSIGAVNLCILNYPGVKCSGSLMCSDGMTIISEDERSKSSPGCLAVAYTDTSVRLFCLHKMCIISECESIFPRQTDQITVLSFCSPYYLIVGTRNGLLILLSLANDNRSDLIEGEKPQPILIKRIMKDHLLSNQISMPIHCIDTYEQALSYDYYLNKLQEKTFINNGSLKRNSHNLDGVEDKQSESWICLAIGGGNRLSVWNLSICSDTYHNPLRFYLIGWLPLESLQWINDISTNGDINNITTNNNSNEMEANEYSFHAMFLPTHNLKDTLELAKNDRNHQEIFEKHKHPHILIYGSRTSNDKTCLWIYSLDNLVKNRSTPQPWLHIPGRVEFINPVFIHQSSDTVNSIDKKSSSLCLYMIVLMRTQQHRTEIHISKFYSSNGLHSRWRKLTGPQSVPISSHLRHRNSVNTLPVLRTIVQSEKGKICIAAAYGRELLIWEESDNLEISSLNN
ncbi:unnamed protein product [Trichobilharzia szidati]|nr:unnamed protein product [Trichobilharzia szidati]